MIAMRRTDRQDEEDPQDPEAPDEPDADLLGDDATDPCEKCGKPVYEDTAWCPHCGHASGAAEDSGSPPMWIIVAAVLALAGMLWWAM